MGHTHKQRNSTPCVHHAMIRLTLDGKDVAKQRWAAATVGSRPLGERGLLYTSQRKVLRVGSVGHVVTGGRTRAPPLSPRRRDESRGVHRND